MPARYGAPPVGEFDLRSPDCIFFGIVQQLKTLPILLSFRLSFTDVRPALWFDGYLSPPSPGPTPLLFTDEQIPQTNLLHVQPSHNICFLEDLD